MSIITIRSNLPVMSLPHAAFLSQFVENSLRQCISIREGAPDGTEIHAICKCRGCFCLNRCCHAEMILRLAECLLFLRLDPEWLFCHS